MDITKPYKFIGFGALSTGVRTAGVSPLWTMCLTDDRGIHYRGHGLGSGLGRGGGLGSGLGRGGGLRLSPAQLLHFGSFFVCLFLFVFWEIVGSS